MKATDLMIGDWVKIKGHLDCDKVREIARDENMQWYISFSCSASLFRAYEFEPIPLTPEILEKNGFCFVKSSDRDTVWNGWWIYKGLELGTCCLDREGNWPCCINITDSNVPCEYVHQVQHALRLCELDELANNFKLQKRYEANIGFT